jgi:Fic-DOC domain mobile mystery protein B
VIDPLAVPEGDGQTELSEEDRLGLRLSYISNRLELFDAEQRNVVDALLRPVPPTSQLLDDKYLRELHRAMFGTVWQWAGAYRTTGKNIGVVATEIPSGVLNLVRDAAVWVEAGTGLPADSDELAVRFHHRLVAIHPFPNGNGRHARVAADYLAIGLGRPRFSWGRNIEEPPAEVRVRYLRALRRADAGDLVELIEFARS